MNTRRLVEVKYSKLAQAWGVYDKDGWAVAYADTPKEAKRIGRQWYLYLCAPTDELAQYYLNGFSKVK